MQDEEDHYLYLLWVYIAGRYYLKIGVSNIPPRRFEQLSSGIPEPIGHAIILPGPRTAVQGGGRMFHKRYKEYRRSGEWFRGRMPSSLDLYADVIKMLSFWKTDHDGFSFIVYKPKHKGRVTRMEDTGDDVQIVMMTMLDALTMDMDKSGNLAAGVVPFTLCRYSVNEGAEEDEPEKLIEPTAV